MILMPQKFCVEQNPCGSVYVLNHYSCQYTVVVVALVVVLPRYVIATFTILRITLSGIFSWHVKHL